MPGTSAVSRSLARTVLLYGTGEQPEPEALAGAAERANARLRERMANLIGVTGYTILVSRALSLARADIPALEHVTIDARSAGILHGIREFVLANGDPRVAEAGLIAILSHIIGLLTTFIGEDLAVRLVREAWPELARGPFESERQQ